MSSSVHVVGASETTLPLDLLYGLATSLCTCLPLVVIEAVFVLSPHSPARVVFDHRLIRHHVVLSSILVIIVVLLAICISLTISPICGTAVVLRGLITVLLVSLVVATMPRQNNVAKCPRTLTRLS